MLFRCRKVLFNDRERSVTCQGYSFRPIKLNEQGLLHFLQVPCQMYWMYVTKIMLFLAFFMILWQMYTIHSSVFMFVKGYPECDPHISFFKWEILEPTCSHQQSIQQRKRGEKHQNFSFCSQHLVFNRFLFLADIWKTNLMKFAVI